MSTDQIGQPLVAQLPAERIRPKILGELMPISQTPSGKSGSFSAQSLRIMRQFFPSFSIRSALRSELPWTHYRLLLRVEKPDVRAWCLKEAADQIWSTRALERQINSLYYERLLLSRDPGRSDDD